jgi:hypothetical protein
LLSGHGCGSRRTVSSSTACEMTAASAPSMFTAAPLGQRPVAHGPRTTSRHGLGSRLTRGRWRAARRREIVKHAVHQAEQQAVGGGASRRKSRRPSMTFGQRYAWETLRNERTDRPWVRGGRHCLRAFTRTCLPEEHRYLPEPIGHRPSRICVAPPPPQHRCGRA